MVLAANVDRAREVGLKLVELLKADGISGHRDMPESLPPKGVDRGSYEHVLFITMTVAIDYMRDAPELWQSSRETYGDPETNWVFVPTEVGRRSRDELVLALQKHKLSRKPRRDALEIWHVIADTLERGFSSDPRKLLENCNFDAKKVMATIKSRKREFPYLSGTKILPLWLRMLKDEADLQMSNMDQMPIPIDVHIARATICTGALMGKYDASISSAWNLIDRVWEEASKGTGIYRLQFDEPLWNLSKYVCSLRSPEKCNMRDQCPVSRFCVDGYLSVSQGKGIRADTSIC